nr:hypothetical protein [uncultured Gellertiella sp.]
MLGWKALSGLFGAGRRSTADLQTRMRLHVETWSRINLTLENTDRQRAESGLRLAYQAAGLAVPRQVIWHRGSMSGVLAVVDLLRTGQAARSCLGPLFRHRLDRIEKQMNSRLWLALDYGIRQEVDDHPWDRVESGLWQEIRAGARDQTDRALRDEALRLATGHDIGLLALYAYLVEHLGYEGRDALDGLTAVMCHSGWWWPFDDLVVPTDRPVEIHRDETGQVSRDDGPAVLYADGWGI